MKTEGAKRSSWAQGEIDEFYKEKPTATQLVERIKYIDKWDKEVRTMVAKMSEDAQREIDEFCKKKPTVAELFERIKYIDARDKAVAEVNKKMKESGDAIKSREKRRIEIMRAGQNGTLSDEIIGCAA